MILKKELPITSLHSSSSRSSETPSLSEDGGNAVHHYFIRLNEQHHYDNYLEGSSDPLLSVKQSLIPSSVADPDPIICQDPDPFPECLRSGFGSISFSNEHNKINWKGKFNKEYLLDLLTRKIK
jgi:hypothetical protein